MIYTTGENILAKFYSMTGLIGDPKLLDGFGAKEHQGPSSYMFNLRDFEALYMCQPYTGILKSKHYLCKTKSNKLIVK